MFCLSWLLEKQYKILFVNDTSSYYCYLLFVKAGFSNNNKKRLNRETIGIARGFKVKHDKIIFRIKMFSVYFYKGLLPPDV